MSEEDAAPAQEAETVPVETTSEVEAPEAETEQQQFDKDYVKKLRAEAAKWRSEAQEARAKAQEYEDAQKSELERAQDKLAQTEQAKAHAEATLLRYEVAAEKNIPGNLMDLLVGDTKEELEQKADLILENVKPAEAPQATFDGGPREPAPEPKTADQAHNELIVGLLGKTNK